MMDKPTSQLRRIDIAVHGPKGTGLYSLTDFVDIEIWVNGKLDADGIALVEKTKRFLLMVSASDDGYCLTLQEGTSPNNMEHLYDYDTRGLENKP
jgi:hypothetical protein